MREERARRVSLDQVVAGGGSALQAHAASSDTTRSVSARDKRAAASRQTASGTRELHGARAGRVAEHHRGASSRAQSTQAQGTTSIGGHARMHARTRPRRPNARDASRGRAEHAGAGQRGRRAPKQATRHTTTAGESEWTADRATAAPCSSEPRQRTPRSGGSQEQTGGGASRGEQSGINIGRTRQRYPTTLPSQKHRGTHATAHSLGQLQEYASQGV